MAAAINTTGRASLEQDPEKHSPVVQTNALPADTLRDSDEESDVKQDGVKNAEAITSLWPRNMLWVIFVLLWLVSFSMALLGSVDGALSPYVTSSFSQHGLLGVISIVSRIIGGVVTLAIAKTIDIRGRLEGFIGAVVLVVIGAIMKAACQNVTTYAAAAVFTWVGNVAVGFIIDIFVADITTLRNRMIIFTLNSTPHIITTFAGAKIAELFYKYHNFRLAFIACAIIFVGLSLPVIAIMWYYEREAKKAGLIREKSGRTTFESLKYYWVQFDFIGMILIIAGFALLLLPFSLVRTIGGGWTAPTVIVMIVLGVVILACFVAWEKFFAPVMFFPFHLLRDRTILGAALAYFVMFLSTFIWNGYYSSYLQVVHGLSISISNYVLNAYSLTSYFCSPFIAWYIRWSGQVKWPAMIAVPIYLMSTALIIYFRKPDTSVGYVTMCQVLIGFSTGMLSTMSQLILMAAAGHANVAVAIAIYGLFGSIGSSTGYAIAAGLWTNQLPQKLERYLPEESKNLTATIYGDIKQQLAYPIGHPIRDAVIHAYGDVMRSMTIAGACLCPLLVASILMWRNINVKDVQEKEKSKRGNIF
ncbi:unnamed protein product [Clonostachys byssicola]|uniref:Siderophore iron transporter mirB n=1 Tax=Clonostachys byssicola TaxID=160290 RepID=A0A9N9UEW2_9HYPO|nr:unnamed protein product [Clonostachys byssicola]